LKQMLINQKERQEVKQVQAEDDDCARPGFTYTPSIGQLPEHTKSSNECRAHCRTLDGAGYFTFYAALGLCHCAPYGAAKTEVADLNNLAGRLECGSGWKGSEEGQEIQEDVESTCFKMGVGFGPMIGEPIPTSAKDVLDCQKQLQQAGVAAAQHFTFDPSSGMCRIVAPGAPEMAMAGVMSGPKACEDLNRIQLKADWRSVASLAESKMVRFVGIPAGVMLVLLMVVGASIQVRRRAQKKRRCFFRASRDTDLEGMESEMAEPCIWE